VPVPAARTSHATKAMIASILDAMTFVFLPVSTVRIAARVMCAGPILKIKHSGVALNLV
jgi:hypothetical protein